MTLEKYIIDGGGGDIRVEMSKMNFIDSIAFKPLDLRNGAISDYLFTLDSFVYLKNGDIINVQMPPQVEPTEDISCSVISPEPIGVLEASC